MWRIISLLFTIFILGSGAWLVLNRQYVSDIIVAQQYEMPRDMQEIATTIQLTPRGSFLLDASRAQIAEKDTFNTKCQKREQNSIVLGCYIHPNELYVYNVIDDRLDGVKQTTTAHELLHAVYERLSDSEKVTINAAIEQALPEILRANPSLKKRIALYDRIEPGERLNELHSIIGTEVANLPAELEMHYVLIFKNRAAVVNYAEKYTDVFLDLQEQQSTILTNLKNMAQDISVQSQDYTQNLKMLNQDIDTFNRQADTGYFATESEFNSQRSILLNRRANLEAQKQQINQKIDEYNRQRDRLLALNIQVEELNSKLDSTAPAQL